MNKQIEINIKDHNGKYICWVEGKMLRMDYNLVGEPIFSLNSEMTLGGWQVFDHLNQAKYAATKYLDSLKAKNIKAELLQANPKSL